MSELETLKVQSRVRMGKGESRRLRSEGFVPGIYYNSDGENVPVKVHEMPLYKMFQKMGYAHVFNLDIEDDKGKGEKVDRYVHHVPSPVIQIL